MVVHNVLDGEGHILLEVLDALRQGAQGSSAVTVRVLAATDHDGVCAAKIIEQVLQRAAVKYYIVPVTGNTDIIEHLRELGPDSEVRSLVLLNCGASLDLQRQLEDTDAPQNLNCFVIDSHRPFLLANLSARNQRVVVIDDDPKAEANDTRPPVDEVEDDDDGAASQHGDSDEEKENVWDDGGQGQAPGQSVAERRDRKRRREYDRIEKRETKRQRINEYYLTSYYATPAALSLFKMAKQASAPSQDLLWLAAVSLAGYHDLGLVSEADYNRLAWEELNEALERTDEYQLGSTQGSTQTDPLSMPSDDEGGESSAPQRPAPRTREKHRLRFETELRLSLYKHWTLEESMLHSSYFYGTLEMHRDKGLRQLKNFFATAGIPPGDHKQMYSGMQMPIRKQLHKKFRDHGKAYGLTENNMFLKQFVRDLGRPGDSNAALFLNELSSMDAVHIMTSLLSQVPTALNGTNLESLPQTADGRRDTEKVAELERQGLVDNFWRAFDAVLCKDPAPLRDGLTQAVEVVKTIQSLARLLKDTKAVHSCRQFRWVKLEQPPSMLRHAMTARRLAVWLLHVLFTYRPKGEGVERPLLVIIRDHVSDTYMCVGATPTRTGLDEFGNRFRNVLRTDRSLKCRYDFFDKSCIQVAADDFDRFWSVMTDA